MKNFVTEIISGVSRCFATSRDVSIKLLSLQVLAMIPEAKGSNSAVLTDFAAAVDVILDSVCQHPSGLLRQAANNVRLKWSNAI